MVSYSDSLFAMTILQLTWRPFSPIVKKQLKIESVVFFGAGGALWSCKFCCLGRLPEGNRHTLQWIVDTNSREITHKESLLMAAQEA
jgi:Zn-finger protein